MDPLQLLRNFFVNNQLDKIVTVDDRIKFGDDFSFRKSVPTAYKSQLGKGKFYTIETLLNFLKFFHGGKGAASFSDYLQHSRSKGLEHVLFVDRKDLESFLTGATDSSVHIHDAVPEFVVHETPQLGSDRPLKRTKTEGESTDKNKATETVAAELKDVLAHERVLRDRNSQLIVPNKSGRRVLELYRVTIEADRAAAARAAAEPASAPPLSSKGPPRPLPVLPSRRFERPTGESMDVADLGGAQIQGYGVAGAPQKVKDHHSSTPREGKVSQGHKPPAPSGAPGTSGRPVPTESHHRPHHGHGHDHRNRTHHGRGSSSREGPPIIIVPAAMTSRINMFNAKEFLESGIYRTPEECQKAGIKKQPLAVFERRIGRDKPVIYHVSDKAPVKGHKDWYRLVAIFTTGQLWQFRDYPFPGLDQGRYGGYVF
eukprot:jgi/Botrbrau1/18547/Bobra.0870s0003.1